MNIYYINFWAADADNDRWEGKLSFQKESMCVKVKI